VTESVIPQPIRRKNKNLYTTFIAYDMSQEGILFASSIEEKALAV